MKPPFVPTYVGVTSVVPSGLPIETRALQQVDVPMVTPLTRRLTRCSAVPVKARSASPPESAIVTVTGSPSGTIVIGTTPETDRVAVDPPVVAETVTRRGPSLSGTKTPVKRPSPLAARSIGSPLAVALTDTAVGSPQPAAIAETVTGWPRAATKPLAGASSETCGVATH